MTESEIIRELSLRWVTKWELCDMLGLARTKNNERRARAYTESLTKQLIGKNSCVLSTASKEGYHISNPRSEEDMMLARKAVNELKSKAISIFERRKPIENFISYAFPWRMHKTMFNYHYSIKNGNYS